ncbi:MAG TPA: hypothetical protein VMD27_04110 [Candidatus Aquilonibacter sp.]|nr:hypothetical protein [Candidatus Aquilonibacter sp.]
MNESQNPKPENEAELLRSLGKLARGLSALFWGLPTTLIVCAETTRAEVLKPFGIIPALAANGLLLFGLWQMGGFQKQERPWRNVLDRAKLLGLVNLGLCPFLYWQNKMPGQPYFNAAVLVLLLSALLFLFNLNAVIKQLGAMLPDETLRHETRLFTLLDRWLLVALLFFGTAYVVLLQDPRLPDALGTLFVWLNTFGFWGLTFFALLPLAMTMALIWKTKETILDGVFGARH